MTNLTLAIHFCDISQSFVSATKYEIPGRTVIRRGFFQRFFSLVMWTRTQKKKNKCLCYSDHIF
jgi:hypothetical protein